jgi:hypothetical protein
MVVPFGARTVPVGDSVPPGEGVSPTPESEHATIAIESATAATAATRGPRRRLRVVGIVVGVVAVGRGERIPPSYPAGDSPTTIRWRRAW